MKRMRINYYRYFINETKQGKLFKDEKTPDEILIEILKSDHVKKFEYRKSVLGLRVIRQHEKYVYCKLGKRGKISRHLSPDDNFRKESEENWPYVNVFIDTSRNTNGQVIAMEDKSSIFRNPLGILRVLSDRINEVFANNGYLLSVNSISSRNNFWTIVKENEGKIEELKFTYNVPNLFKVKDSLNKDLKEAEKNYNATETSITLKNPVGNLKIDDNDKLINESLDYISNGGGKYRLKIEQKYYTDDTKTLNKSLNIEIDSDDSNTITDALSRVLSDSILKDNK